MLELVMLAVGNEMAQICEDLFLEGFEVVWNWLTLEVEGGDQGFEVLGSWLGGQDLLDFLD